MKFTVEEAINFAKKDRINEWIHKFLTTAGKNNHLSEIMKHQGHFYGPIEISFQKLKRCCGPEKNMKFHESKDKWGEIIATMISEIKDGWQVPPLIVWQINSNLSIADGNHRFEALKKCGFNKYWAIIWFKSSEDFKRFKCP
ncbi:MAG: ParB N-terminal domain-containing protein [Candidatus Woesearchaeota archaeon]